MSKGIIVAVAKGVSLVAIQTLARPVRTNNTPSILPSRPLHLALPVKSTPATRRAASHQKIAPAKLEAVEERLLAEAIDRHANVEAALDGALDDMAVLSAELRRSRRRPLLLRSTTNLGRVEDLLLEAILRTHPNREHALDRLLDDATAGDEAAAEDAHLDTRIDNDFDGMS